MAMYTWIAIQYTASPSLAVGCRISNRPPTTHNPSSLSASALILFGTSDEFVSELNPCPDHKKKKTDKCEIPELKFSCPWCLKPDIGQIV
jgi:hypothetical protein